ncbi:helix-turn-helix transcriptional regulator [Clostridium paraputrificum]|uniref:helix-turn-helix transcriptional regulator n=1 Tax=Clostridium paraputrificum TaxID=29363 RepID=UPI00232E9768|nr:helix-turn-helix domain-containing protein [Clostridium paraputrificum]MDB2122164.1 helix-turn-helix domain-containing protein [Clostridium paraputrificum]
MNGFKDRLIDYRNELRIPTQTEMASRLGLSRQLYSNLENGTKTPSKNVLKKLVNDSGLPEEYWVYGVDPNRYIDERKEFKCLYTMLERLEDSELLDLKDGDWSQEVKDMLLSALKADIVHLRFKKEKDR